jgi:predicted nucleic acid-binding protein
VILDINTIDVSSKLYYDLGRKGRLIGEFDVLIAAFCLAKGKPLITNDSDFDAIRNLARISC